MSGIINSIKNFINPDRTEEIMAARQLVDKLIVENSIVMFSKSYCPYCRRAKSLLNDIGQKNFKVLELDHEANGDEIQAAIAQREKQGRVTVPQVYIHGKHIGGSDDLAAAKRSGELDKLLQANL